MSRAARLRTLSSSARARTYCSQWVLARSSASASERCRRSRSTNSAAVSGSTVVRSLPDSFAVIVREPPEGLRARSWGSATQIQGGPEQFSRHVDDGYHPLVRHARRPDHPQDTHHRLSVRVGGRDHAAGVEDLVAGLVADEDLHPLGLQAVVEQVQEVALLIERLEEPAQLLDAGELGHAHEIGLTLDHVLEPLLR